MSNFIVGAVSADGLAPLGTKPSAETVMIEFPSHYDDVIMSAMASQITSLTIVCSKVYSGRSKDTSKLRVTGLYAQNSLMTGEFPAQRASKAENIFIWWRHHVLMLLIRITLMLTRLQHKNAQVRFCREINIIPNLTTLQIKNKHWVQ